MTFQSLYIGVSGLSAAQRAIDVAAHNVANANTPGYTRQRVDLQASQPIPGVFGRQGTGMKGTGVTVADLVRIRNEFVDATFRAEGANGGAWDARANTLRRAEQVLGPLDSGASSLLSEFWGAWDNLSLYPTDTSARQEVLNRGSLLADAINSASRQLTSLSRDTSDLIRDEVDEVNSIIVEIAELNRGIKDASVGKNLPGDLMDRRDLLLDRLSELTGATSHKTDFDQVTVQIGTVAVVFQEQTVPLNVSDTNPPTITYSTTGAPVQVAGSVGARMELVYADLPSLHGDLDAIATGLRDLVNTQHAAGFDRDGNPGVDFFTGTDGTTFSVNAALTTRMIAASASGQPNDGNNAVSMSGLRNQPAVGTDTAIDAFAALGSRIGAMSLAASRGSDASATVRSSLTEERAVVNSVSIDEELAEMIRFQRAYEAAARVVTVADSLLDTLINRTGLR